MQYALENNNMNWWNLLEISLIIFNS
jgi:hypothetical protein